MKTGILSDVHGNLEALTAVLRDATAQRVDHVVCLGDSVGYGADPDKCLDILFEACSVLVAGNHDLAATGRLSGERFNALARFAVDYARSRLTEAQYRRLATLPLEAEHAGLLLVHASPARPASFPYVKEPAAAAAEFRARPFRVAVYGHTHLPMAFQHLGPDVSVSLNPRIELRERGRYLVNVGSVGQPRDCDPRAAYAIHDSERGQIVLRRVAYDVQAATERIRSQGLPVALGRRLLAGI